jgi:hypothetical protein
LDSRTKDPARAQHLRSPPLVSPHFDALWRKWEPRKILGPGTKRQMPATG